tara:strand:- start:22582 stop:25155 length:2574 start_codon:yes stop_codon:yes gene_type:complete
MGVQKQEIIVNVTTNTKKAQANVGKLNKDLKETGKAGKAAGTGLATSFGIFGGTVIPALIAQLQVLKTQLISTGVGAIVVAVGALATVFIAAAKASIEFEEKSAGLKAILSGSAESAQILDEDLEALTQQAKELGSTTAFTASQVLELQTNLAKIGFTTDDILNATAATLDFAGALDVDLGSAAEFAGSVVSSFGLTTKETQRVVDALALSTSKSALDFSLLRESIKTVAPVARAVNMTVEETTALLGILADNGIKGSRAGTGLSAALIELNKKGIPLNEALKNVSESTNGLNTAMDLAGKQGGKVLLNLAGSGPEKIQALTDALNDADGSAKQLAEMKLDNVKGDVKKLSSAWEGLMLQIEDGDGILNTLMRGTLFLITNAISSFTFALQFLSFSAKEVWNDIKLNTESGAAFTKGLFFGLQGAVLKFVAKMKLGISEIPLIGRAIDVGKARRQLREAQDLLLDASEQFQISSNLQTERWYNIKTAGARFFEEQAGKRRVKEEAETAKANEAILEKQKKLNAEQLAEEKKRLETVEKLRSKFAKKLEDQEDLNDEQKLARKRERALKEIEDSVATATEKAELIKQVNEFYDNEVAIKEEAKAQKLADKMAKFEEDEILKLEAQREKELAELDALDAHEDMKAQVIAFYAGKIGDINQKKIDKEASEEEKLAKQKKKLANDALNLAIETAGSETKIGKALFIAKQALALKEIIMKAKSAITTANLNAAESGSDIAKGQSKAASSLAPPWNLVPIAMFAMQAVGIIKSINQSKKKVSSVAGGMGGGSGPDVSLSATPSVSDSLPEPMEPDFDIIGTSGTNQIASALGQQAPVQAFVVSQDVTSAQSLQNNIISGSTLG